MHAFQVVDQSCAAKRHQKSQQTRALHQAFACTDAALNKEDEKDLVGLSMEDLHSNVNPQTCSFVWQEPCHCNAFKSHLLRARHELIDAEKNVCQGPHRHLLVLHAHQCCLCRHLGIWRRGRAHPCLTRCRPCSAFARSFKAYLRGQAASQGPEVPSPEDPAEP